MKQFYLPIFLTILFWNFCAFAQVTLIERDYLTDSGLYFEGSKYDPDNPSENPPSEGNTAYRFGKKITPYGPSPMDVVGDYVYVAWYKGDMAERNVMLSRRLITDGQWVHLTLPHQHIGYRGDPYIGDSHNYITVKVCTVDNTIHMIYDMHSYEADEYGEDNYFNYSVSIPGGAVVDDSNWTTSYLFENQEGGKTKRNYLKEGLNYEDGTYPELARTATGELIYNMRYGGSGNGDNSHSYYDGSDWSDQTTFNIGRQPVSDNRYNIYGSFKYLHGKYRAGFAIRYANRMSFDPTYSHNSGLYYTHSNVENDVYKWYDHTQYDYATETPLTLPIQDISDTEFVNDTEFMLDNDEMTSLPAWTATENDAVHFFTDIRRKDNEGVKYNVYGHYFKTKKASTITKVLDSGLDFGGQLISYGNYVYLVGLDNNRIKIARTLDNESNWTVVYDDTSESGSKTYRHGNVYIHKNKIYYCVMRVGSGTAQAIYLTIFDLVEDIIVEAEDYNEGGFSDFDPGNNGGAYRNDDVDIAEKPNASNGHAVIDFKGNDWMEYTFDVATPGVYEVYLHAANFKKDVATTEFTLDGTVIDNFNVKISGDWEEFSYSKLPQTVTLTARQHTFKLRQRSSLSSSPDKIRFVYQHHDDNLAVDAIEDSSAAIKLYPNPAKNEFAIAGAETNATYEISNANGKLVKRGTIQETTELVDTSNLSSGLYFVRIHSHNQIVVKKLILL